MNKLADRLADAGQDNEKMNKLIAEYMPFIKSEVYKTPVFEMDYDDRLSIAMCVFMNCARQYKEGRGAFLPFAAVCIKNRLIDEGRKFRRERERSAPLDPEEDRAGIEERISMQEYSRRQERDNFADEIDRLESALSFFGITLRNLSGICPKQKRSRELCIRLANETIRNDKMKSSLMDRKRLPQSELAKRFGISEKTVEKHRKYIVAVAVILSGDFPGISAFLPMAEEVR
ncbi:MAG: sigma-70 family RNA polymerase sigma factor [Clostridiales bacterium]|nr:sigma-70 family RNA polymerase sigma factor [Clostridiales bacterium]